MTEPFIYLLRVRYAECDAQEVVFNAKYVEYIDVAVMEYFRAVFGDYRNLLEKGMDTQVVNVSVSWKAPATFDDVLALEFELKKIGTTSITYTINFSNYETKKPIAVGEITYVMVRMKEHQKKAIPKDVRDQFERGASGIINHAGIEIIERSV